MNLPDWATHVAVDGDGTVYAYSGKPVPSASNKADDFVWDNPPRVQYVFVCGPSKPRAYIPPQIARLLCVAIPRPEREDEELRKNVVHPEIRPEGEP